MMEEEEGGGSGGGGGPRMAGGCNGAVALVKLDGAEPGKDDVLVVKLVYNYGAFSTTRAAAAADGEFRTLLEIPRHHNVMRVHWTATLEPTVEMVEALPLDEEVRRLCMRENPRTGRVTMAPLQTLLIEALEKTLEKVLEEQPRGFIPWPKAQGWFAQMTAGVAHLYRHRVVHLDLKPDNLMFAGDRLVIIDFGCSKRFKLEGEGRGGGGDGGGEGGEEDHDLGVCSAQAPLPVGEADWAALTSPPPMQISLGDITVSLSSPYGNIAHVAPEVQNAVKQGSDSRDGTVIIDYTKQPIFALGVLFGEVLLGEDPLRGYPAAFSPRSSSSTETPAVAPYEVPEDLFPEAAPYPVEFKALVRRMLAFDPAERPSMAEVLQFLWDRKDEE